MHSRIFQVTKREPGDADVCDESRYYDWSVPDYIKSVSNRNCDLFKEELGKQLLDWIDGLPGIEVDVEALTIKVVSKGYALAGEYAGFLRAIDKLAKMPFDAFADAHWNEYVREWWKAKDSWSSEVGLYFDDNDEYFGLVSFQDFIRLSQDGDVYSVMAVFYYHW